MDFVRVSIKDNKYSKSAVFIAFLIDYKNCSK